MVLEPLVTRLSLIPVTQSIFWLNRLRGKIQWYSVPSRSNASVGNSVAQFTFLLRGFWGNPVVQFTFLFKGFGGNPVVHFTLFFKGLREKSNDAVYPCSKTFRETPVVHFTLLFNGLDLWYRAGGIWKVGCSHNQRTFIIEGKSFALAAAQTHHVRLLSNGSC